MKGYAQVARDLGISFSRVWTHATKNKVPPRIQYKPLNQQDKDFIKENACIMSVSAMAKALGSRNSSVSHYAQAKGICVRKYQWPDGDLEYIQKWYQHWGAKNVAKDLGQKRERVGQKARQMKLHMLPIKQRICYHCKVNMCEKLNGKYECSSCSKIRITEEYKRRSNKDIFHTKITHFLSHAKGRSLCRGMPFDIDINFIRELWDEQDGKCFYSGVPMLLSEHGNGRNLLNISIDRMDSKRGYTKDNVVLTTVFCNVAKTDSSIKEFIDMCETVARHNGRFKTDSSLIEDHVVEFEKV